MKTRPKVVACAPSGKAANGNYYHEGKVHSPLCWTVAHHLQSGFDYKLATMNNLPAKAVDCKYCGGRHY